MELCECRYRSEFCLLQLIWVCKFVMKVNIFENRAEVYLRFIGIY